MMSANRASPSNQMDWLTTKRDLALAVGLHVAVGLGHRADERAAVAVVHLHVRVARRPGTGTCVNCDSMDAAAEALAAPLEALVVHGLGDAQPGDDLALGRVLRVGERAAVRPHAVRRAACRRRCRRCRRRCRPRRSRGRRTTRSKGAPRGGGPDVAARLAQALHGRQGDHGPGPLVAGGGAAGAAPAAHAAGGQHGLLAAPLPGQRADLAGGDAALDLGPLRRLGHAVAVARARSPSTRRSRGCGRRRIPCRTVPSVSHTKAMARPSATSVPSRGREPLVADRGRRCGCSRGR